MVASFPSFLGKAMNYKASLIAAAQAIVFFISAFFIPLLGLMLTPLPLIMVYVRHGRREGLFSVVLSSAVIAAVAGWSVAFVFLFCFGFMAIGASEGMRRRLKPEMVALSGALIPLAVLSFMAARFFARTRQNPITFLETVLREQKTLAVKLYTDLSLPKFADAVSSVPDSFIHYFALLTPGIVVTAIVLLAGMCSILAGALIMRKPGSAPTIVRMPLAQWHAPDAWVWGLIVGLVLIMVPGQAAVAIGLNLAVIHAVLYLIQGVAIVDHYLRKVRVQPVIRGLLHMLILSLPTIVFVIALGVVDIWADFRKVRGPLNAV